MRKSNTIILAIILLITISVNAQDSRKIQFKTGSISLENNINQQIESSNYSASELVNGNYYRLIQFETIPTSAQKEALKNIGIELLEYMPINAFYASINENADLRSLLKLHATSIAKVKAGYKLNTVLKSGIYPEWAMYGKNMIEINAVYHDNISREHILNLLEERGLEVTMDNDAQIVRFRVKITDLELIYSLPEFYYFEELSEPGKPEGIEDRTNHRSNVLATDYLGGLKFDGTGVTVMLQDNSILNNHIDFTGRYTNAASAAQTGGHGEHTGGIIGAAGNLDPKGRGMAFGSDVLVYGSSNNNYNDVPTLYTSSNLTITSKSYGDGANAGYTSLSRQLDQQVRNMPSLIHVFSAGNSGSGWSTITGGHKQGKNVVAVGNLTYTDGIAGSSSRGPALDGRIKPDICAVGTSVYSTLEPNSYQNMTGTSMACPGVAGTLAQLYDAYKSINAGANPNSGLIKGAVLNTGEDLGNAGPDFTYGWGRINARRAYNTLSNNNYLSATISQGGNNTHNITVPAGTSQLRVMVYWSDYEAAASAAPALVNDINMQLINPSATSFNPWVLNPSLQSAVAVRGVDNLNNMEQVTIDNPSAGTYTVDVSGFSIPQGPQEYFVIYEFVQDEVVLTYPIGREGFAPGTVETIRWDSYGATGTFNLEYSTDNGGSWNTINASVNASLRYYDWTVPSTLTGQALVRVTRGAKVGISDQVFSIIPTPTNLQVDWACPDSMQLSWNAVSGATSYEVSMLGAKYMDSVGVSTTNSFVLTGIQSNLTYWLSVRSLGPTNARGERAIAIEKTPGTFSCPIAVDASLSGLTPLDNGDLLSCMFPGNLDVDINIKNEGTNSISNIPVHYTLNGGTAVNEIYAGPIASGATFNYTFTVQLTPVVGTNNIVAWNDITGDGNSFNDTVISQFNYTSSVAQSLPWTEDFETFSLCGTASDCELEICSLNNDFINEANGSIDDIDWRTDQGGTVSSNTGPSQDFNPGTSSGNYLYLETSGTCSSQQANLISPCLDLTSASVAQLDFAYSMYGATMGSLHVDVYSNGVWTNDVMPVLSGNKGTAWLTKTVSLTSFVGNIINLRFRGISGSSFTSDMAIDDINVSTNVGIDDYVVGMDLSIHPNPSNGIFNYQYDGEDDLSIEVLDMNGRLIYTKTLIGNQKAKGVINISDYANGVYMVALTTDTKRVVKKVVKQ